MHTLVLRQVPDALYRRLKAVAAAHRRSMNQEAILALEAGLPEAPIAQPPTLKESRHWLEHQVWCLPVLDRRSAEAILGSAMTVSAAEGSLVIDLAVDTNKVSAPTRTQILLVALVKLGDIGQERALEFLDQQALLTVAWDEELADQAALAFSRYGMGRHASGLNFGDCFSYALTGRLRVPLLFVGNDFSRTDLEAAL
ncbi:MAG: FitA-like ribbon-helix-helix domain-containing protein [Cyanobium sp.]